MNKKFWKCSDDVCKLVGAKEIFANLHTFYFGEKVELEIDGKSTTRRVYDGPEGLFVIVKNVRVCYDDFC